MFGLLGGFGYGGFGGLGYGGLGLGGLGYGGLGYGGLGYGGLGYGGLGGLVGGLAGGALFSAFSASNCCGPQIVNHHYHNNFQSAPTSSKSSKNTQQFKNYNAVNYPPPVNFVQYGGYYRNNGPYPNTSYQPVHSEKRNSIADIFPKGSFSDNLRMVGSKEGSTTPYKEAFYLIKKNLKEAFDDARKHEIFIDLEEKKRMTIGEINKVLKEKNLTKIDLSPKELCIFDKEFGGESSLLDMFPKEPIKMKGVGDTEGLAWRLNQAKPKDIDVLRKNKTDILYFIDENMTVFTADPANGMADLLMGPDTKGNFTQGDLLPATSKKALEKLNEAGVLKILKPILNKGRFESNDKSKAKIDFLRECLMKI